MDGKRQLYYLMPEESAAAALENSTGAAKLWKQACLERFHPTPIVPGDLMSPLALQGGVLIIPPAKWPKGTLSNLTRIPDFPFLAIVPDGAEIARIKSWYTLGAEVVFEESVSDAILVCAIERMLDLEVMTLYKRLTKKERIIFDILKRVGERGITREDLSLRIWGGVVVTDKAIDVHLFNLRRKLNGTVFRIQAQNGILRFLENGTKS